MIWFFLLLIPLLLTASNIQYGVKLSFVCVFVVYMCMKELNFGWFLLSYNSGRKKTERKEKGTAKKYIYK